MAALFLKCSRSRGWVYKWWRKLAKTLIAEGTGWQEGRAERETEETGRREGNEEWKKETGNWANNSFSLWSTVLQSSEGLVYREECLFGVRNQWMLVYAAVWWKQMKAKVNGVHSTNRRNTAKITAATSALVWFLQLWRLTANTAVTSGQTSSLDWRKRRN